MEFVSAQRDMSEVYAGGAPAVFVSGAVWLIAGLIERAYGVRIAFTVLFFGGILIFPASVAISRVLFKSPKANPDNPLNRVAIEGTAMLFAGILAGYVLLHAAPALALAVVALAIGARYFTFRSIYDEPVYAALGGILTIAAAVALLRPAVFSLGIALFVGLAECAVSAVLFARWKGRRNHSAAALRL